MSQSQHLAVKKTRHVICFNRTVLYKCQLCTSRSAGCCKYCCCFSCLCYASQSAAWLSAASILATEI